MNLSVNASPRDQEDRLLNQRVAVSLGRLDKAANGK